MKLVVLSSVVIVALLSTPSLGSLMESHPIEVSPNKLVDLLLVRTFLSNIPIILQNANSNLLLDVPMD